MKRKKNTYINISIGALGLLAVMILAATTTRGRKTYTNPVLVETFFIQRAQPDNFSGVLGIGDPAVLFHNGIYYLYPTGDNRGYDVYTSADLVSWRKGPRIFRTLAHGVWAPDVFYDAKNHLFYLYYTVSGRVGVATADRPDTVFKDQGILVENAIDAHMFLDEDGSYYLYYVQYPAFKIHVQPMASPLRKIGDPVQLIEATEAWEKKQAVLTEAPWMVKHRGVYYLLYSAGGADSQDYAIGYATAESPLGPFTKYAGNPMMQKGGGIFGPGHCSVTKAPDGQLWMVYHQQKNGSRGWNRMICIDPLWFDDEGILHGRATRGEVRAAPRVPEGGSG